MLAYAFGLATDVAEAVLILDSALHLAPQMSHWYPLHPDKLTRPPAEMPHTFRIEKRQNRQWIEAARMCAQHQRHVRVPIGRRTDAIRHALEATWGPCEVTNLYACFPRESPCSGSSGVRDDGLNKEDS